MEKEKLVYAVTARPQELRPEIIKKGLNFFSSELAGMSEQEIFEKYCTSIINISRGTVAQQTVEDAKKMGNYGSHSDKFIAQDLMDKLALEINCMAGELLFRRLCIC